MLHGYRSLIGGCCESEPPLPRSGDGVIGGEVGVSRVVVAKGGAGEGREESQAP